jgi:hypothetical protein
MVFEVLDNLLTYTELVTHDGIFYDFRDTDTVMNNNFTNNTNNVGSNYIQYSGELGIDPHASLETRAVKYQNVLALAPVNALPYPRYVEITLETIIRLDDDFVTFAGFSLSHSDLNFGTAANRLWAGIYRESGNNGIRMYLGSLTATNFTTPTINLAQDYVLKVVLKVDMLTDPTIRKGYITVVLDGTIVVDEQEFNLSLLTGYQIDGQVGIATITQANEGKVSYFYFCCNRVEDPEELVYELSTLYKIPQLSMKILNDELYTEKLLNFDSLLNVYGRNSTVTEEITRNKVFIDTIEDLTTNLQVKYDLNGDYNDTSGNGNHSPSQVGASFTSYGSRQVAVLTDAASYIYLPTLNIDWSNGFTISFWVKPFQNVSAATLPLFQFESSSPSGANRIRIARTNTADIVVDITDGTPTSLLSITAVNALTRDVSVYITLTMDESKLVTLYLNLVPIVSGVATAFPPNVSRDLNYLFGSAVGDDTHFWNLRVWNGTHGLDAIKKDFEANVFLLKDWAFPLLFRIDLNGNVIDTSAYDMNFIQESVPNINYNLKGGYRKVVDFDGIDDAVLININNPIYFILKNGFSIFFRCISDAQPPGNDEYIFSCVTPTAYEIRCMRVLSTDSFKFEAFDSVGVSLGSVTVANFFSNGREVCGCVTVDVNGAVVVYKNGISAGTGSLSALPPDRYRYPKIGKQAAAPGSSTTAWDGKIWDVMFFQSGLSSGQVVLLTESPKFKNRFTGFVRSIDTVGEGGELTDDDLLVMVEASGIQQLFSQRRFTDSFVNKTSDFILTDGTVGVMPTVLPEFTYTNVKKGGYLLSRLYFFDTPLKIIADLAGDEDFLPYIDNSKDLHMEPVGSFDSALHIKENGPLLNDYKIIFNNQTLFDKIEVHGTNIAVTVLSDSQVYKESGSKTGLLIDPAITTENEAIIAGQARLRETKNIQIIQVSINLDYNIDIGEVVRLTVDNTRLKIYNKRFVVINIIEDAILDEQILVLSNITNILPEFLYATQYLADKTNREAMDTSVSASQLLFDFEEPILFHVEMGVYFSTDGITGNRYNIYHLTERLNPVRAILTNRGKSIVSACLGNKVTSSSEGDFSNGLKFYLSSQTEPVDATTKSIRDDGFTVKTIAPSNIVITDSGDDQSIKCEAVWAPGDFPSGSRILNTYGFSIDRQTKAFGSDATHKFATTTDWEYNTDTDLVCVGQMAHPHYDGYYLHVEFTIRVLEFANITEDRGG